MCGRGRQTAPSAQAVAQALQIPVVFQAHPQQQQHGGGAPEDDAEEEDDEYSPFNQGAPGRNAPIVVEGPAASPAVMKIARWGLVPSYQSPATPPDHWRMFNARDDNLVNVHARLINSKRCVVPLEGFFEWENRIELGKKRKVPYYVSSPSLPQLPMAGLWDTWKDVSGRVMDSFTIITVSPSEDLKWLHDRMPAILRSEEEIRMWLDESLPFTKVKHLVRPYIVGGLKWWPVTDSIGKLGYQGDDCITPVELVKGTKSITTFFGSKKKEEGGSLVVESQKQSTSSVTESEMKTNQSTPTKMIKSQPAADETCVDLTEEADKGNEARTGSSTMMKPSASPKTRLSPVKRSPVKDDDARKKVKLTDFFGTKRG